MSHNSRRRNGGGSWNGFAASGWPCAFYLTTVGFAVTTATTANASVTVLAPCDTTAYPPSPDAQIEVSTDTPDPGDTITVTGSGYCPTSPCRITLRGEEVGTATTDDDGNFTATVNVSGPTGDAELCGIGASGQSADQSCLTLDVGGLGTGGEGNGNGNGAGNGSGGGTAVTGVEIAGLIVLALLLLGGGATLLLAGRRRSPRGI